MSKQPHVRQFRNGRNRTVEPARKHGLIALLKSMKPLQEEFSKIDDPVPTSETMPANLNAAG
jgi:antitoxin VapB